MFKQSNVRRNVARRPRRSQKSGPRVVRSLGPIPDRYIVGLKYSGSHTLTSAGTTVPAIQSYRMNSVYDPDLTGVGHQPLGFDQISPLYNKYVVTAVQYVITLSNHSATDYADVAVTLRPNSNAYVTMSTIRETAYTTFAVLGPESGASNIKTIRGKMTVAKIRGVSEEKVKNENDYSALVSTNPVNQPTVQIYVENQNQAAAITVHAAVSIVYTTHFYDRKALTGS